jgi:hypothetical protein
LGHSPSSAADAAIRERIAGTPYLTRVYDYASFYDPSARTFTISCKVNTAFGSIDQAPPGGMISPNGALVVAIGPGPSVEPQEQPRRLLR